MEPETVSLHSARARLGELTELAAAGTDVVIARRGRPMARLAAARAPRKPVDLSRLRALTDNIPCQKKDGAGRALREASARRGKTISQLIDESLEFYGIRAHDGGVERVQRARRCAKLSEPAAMKMAVAEIRVHRRG